MKEKKIEKTGNKVMEDFKLVFGKKNKAKTKIKIASVEVTE